MRDIDALMDALIIEAVKMTDTEYGWTGMRTPDGMRLPQVVSTFPIHSIRILLATGSRMARMGAGT